MDEAHEHAVKLEAPGEAGEIARRVRRTELAIGAHERPPAHPPTLTPATAPSARCTVAPAAMGSRPDWPPHILDDQRPDRALNRVRPA